MAQARLRALAGLVVKSTGAVRSWRAASQSVKWGRLRKPPQRAPGRGRRRRKGLAQRVTVPSLACPASCRSPCQTQERHPHLLSKVAGEGRHKTGGSVEFKLNTHMNLLNPDCVKGRRSGRREWWGIEGQDDGRPWVSQRGARPLPRLAHPLGSAMSASP